MSGRPNRPYRPVQLWALGSDLGAEPAGHQADDRGDRDAGAAYAGNAAHDLVAGGNLPSVRAVIVTLR
jgi:hypothetical protein